MFGLETIEKMNRDLVTYNSHEVLECRANCSKNCCINCESFLSAEVSVNNPGMLLNLICSMRLNDPADVWSGINQCVKYEKP